MRIIEDADLKELVKSKSVTWKDFVKHSKKVDEDLVESVGYTPSRDPTPTSVDSISPALLEVSRSVENQSKIITNMLSFLLTKEQDCKAKNITFSVNRNSSGSVVSMGSGGSEYVVQRDKKGMIESISSPEVTCFVVRDGKGRVSSIELNRKLNNQKN